MRKTTLAIIAASFLVLSGCETLEELCGFSADDLGFTEDYNRHLNAGVYIYQQSDRALRDADLKANNTAIIDGANVTLTTDSIIVDYGLGTIGEDGRERKGSIRIGYSGDYLVAGGTANIRLQNYFENDMPYEANVQLTNTTPSGTTMPQYGIDITSLKLDSLNLVGNLTADWIGGYATSDFNDDDFSLGGNATLTNLNTNVDFVGTIINPLNISTSCDYTFVSGILQLVPSVEGYPIAEVDFIDGDCANLFNATIDCNGSSISSTFTIK